MDCKGLPFSFIEKEEKEKVNKYYVNNKGIHKDVGEECKGVFFDSIQEAFKYWKNLCIAKEA